MFRVCWRGIGVAHNLHLVWLQHPANGVEEEARVFRRPEVQVHRVQPVHVFALVRGIGCGEMPLRRVLVGARAAIVTPECVDREGEQTWVFVRVLDLDCVQLYTACQLVCHGEMCQHSRPEKASWLGVPAWFATSMRPLWRIGLW